jgi:hypothetical protein
MTLKTDIENHWQLFDGIEDVTVTGRHPAATPVTGVKALRRVLTVGQRTYFGGTLGLSPLATVFHLWEATMGGSGVGEGDTITDAAAAVWSIVAIEYSPQTSRYKCFCNPQA